MSRVQATAALSPHPLWFKSDWRPANPLGLEGDGYFDAVGDPDKRDATIHPVLSTVEGHRSINHAGSGALAGDCEEQFFGFSHSTDGKVAINFKGVGPSL